MKKNRAFTLKMEKSMKKIVLCGITAFFMAGCATEYLIRNSLGFDINDQRRTSLDQNGVKLEWVQNPHWTEQENAKDNAERLYFLGQSRFNFSQLTNKKTVYTERDAYDEAWNEMIQSLANYVWSDITSIADGEARKGKDGAEEAAFVKNYITSSITIEGLHTEKFTEMWRRSRMWWSGKQEKEITRCWILVSVPISKIYEARENAKQIRKEARDEEMRQKSLKGIQEKRFFELKDQYAVVKEELVRINFSIDEKKFTEKYQNFLRIDAELNALLTLKDRTDGVGGHKAVTEAIGEDIRQYNPADRQVRMIDGLIKQIIDKDTDIAVKDARIEELNKRLASNNPSESKNSQTDGSINIFTVIPSFPPKHDEQKIKSAPLIAAEEMVSNRDFISFMSVNGVNAFSRGDMGLDFPAVSVSYNDAARYCNWLSKLYRYAPCYTESGGRITGYDKKKNGYRLPEYAEIVVLLDEGVINEAELTQFGIWSSEESGGGHNTYRLDNGSGTIRDRLMSQSFDNALTNSEIGFRVVRNAE